VNGRLSHPADEFVNVSKVAPDAVDVLGGQPHHQCLSDNKNPYGYCPDHGIVSCPIGVGKAAD
jgi:hypothetical protein